MSTSIPERSTSRSTTIPAIVQCAVCNSVTGLPTTHVAFFNYKDVEVDNEAGLNRQPFNAKNPDGPLELCTCAECGAPIMLDDK